MAIGSSPHVALPPANVTTLVPRLEPGDRLTRAEFMRRYEAMPDVKKAELIEGVVYMPSPVRMDVHGLPHASIVTWLGAYASSTAGVQPGDNATIKLDNDNVPQPDALLMIDRAAGGQALIDDSGYVHGAPELVAEISSSTVSIDLHDKLRVYRRNGVAEYIAWRVLDRAIDWFVLRQGEYSQLAAGEGGIVRSEVFPGLWLDAAAMIDGKLDTVLSVLRQGMATNEHRQFVDLVAGRQKNK